MQRMFFSFNINTVYTDKELSINSTNACHWNQSNTKVGSCFPDGSGMETLSVQCPGLKYTDVDVQLIKLAS